MQPPFSPDHHQKPSCSVLHPASIRNHRARTLILLAGCFGPICRRAEQRTALLFPIQESLWPSARPHQASGKATSTLSQSHQNHCSPEPLFTRTPTRKYQVTKSAPNSDGDRSNSHLPTSAAASQLEQMQRTLRLQHHLATSDKVPNGSESSGLHGLDWSWASRH